MSRIVAGVAAVLAAGWGVGCGARTSLEVGETGTNAGSRDSGKVDGDSGEGSSCGPAETLCSGSCVDEQTDPNNCGGCGLVCEVPCKAGHCLITLASDQHPTALAVDHKSVYWTNGLGGSGVSNLGELISVPLGGGALTTLAAGAFSQGEGGSLAIDGSSAYWVSAGSAVQSVPLGGGTVTTLKSTRDSNRNSISGIAIDASSVYFGIGSSVAKVPLRGGEVTTLVSGQSAATCGVRVDSTSIVWTTGVGETVMQLPIVGGSPTTLVSVSGLGETCDLALNDGIAFWTQAPGVMSVPLAGGVVTTLASGEFHPDAIAVDSVNAHWTNDTTVMKVPLSGGTPITIATEQAAPDAIAVGDVSLYWGNFGPCDGTTPNSCTGAVMKLTPK